MESSLDFLMMDDVFRFSRNPRGRKEQISWDTSSRDWRSSFLSDEQKLGGGAGCRRFLGGNTSGDTAIGKLLNNDKDRQSGLITMPVVMVRRLVHAKIAEEVDEDDMEDGKEISTSNLGD